MKVLFIMRNQAYMRNYESTLIALAQRNHQIQIRFNDSKDNDRLVESLSQQFPQITYSYEVLPRRNDLWKSLLRLIRAIRDYLTYLSPEYAQAKKLRKRVEETLGWLGVSLIPIIKLISLLPQNIGLNLIKQIIDIIERIIPIDKTISTVLERENPDLILITPLVDFDCVQRDYLKAAKSLGIYCILCVHSWDNLTNKGSIHIHPDRVLLWNKIQKQEAIEIHDIEPKKVIVTGAQCYDKWFERKPSISKKEFLEKAGLKEENDYLLYLCSSPFIAPDEVSFVRELLAKIRKAEHPKIRKIGLLIRPHPQNATQWNEVEFARENNAVIWPRGGQNPVTEEARANFYDSLYYSVSAIGINTSAMIEAGILGKPVYSILDSRFKDTQEGTLHFHHLIRGGLLQMSASIEEFIGQLTLMLEDDRHQYQDKIKHFINEFVRPYGLETPCTPIVVKSIEEIEAIATSNAESIPLWNYGFRAILFPFALILQGLEYSYKKIKGVYSRAIPKSKIAA
ncbi:MAG: hypothetical protein MUD14_10030 [Hydrococcus sp. Prado102]|jgi:hypothetical protein|nr:hypothetical protein [Hydrococcus sp. Prado102]